MKQHFRLIALVTAALLLGLPFAGHAQSQQVYTWVDKNGVRHYSDQPANPKATLITVKAAPAMSAPPVASSPTAATNNKAQAAAPAQQPRETPAERAARCAKLRQQVKQLQSSRRVVVTQNGKQKFYSGQDLVNLRQQMQESMHAACSPPAQ
ncbi:MAG: DUF4124 domain-containing protein [Gammaproteobacteria bacterium]